MRKKSIILAIALVIISSVLTMACAKENRKNTYLHDDKTEKNEQKDTKADGQDNKELEEKNLQTDSKPGVEEEQKLEEKPLLEETPAEDFGCVNAYTPGYVYIDSYRGKETNIVIPKEIDGKLVVGVRAFFHGVDSVVFQYPLEYVMIKFSDIKDLSFTESCEKILVRDCDYLTEMRIPKGYVRANIYQCDRLKSIILPPETKRQDVVIEECPEITSIIYPEGTEDILGGYWGNANLQTIEFPSTIKRLIPEQEDYNESMSFYNRSESHICEMFSNYPKERYEIEALPFYLTFENDNLDKLVFHMRVNSAPDSILKVINEGVPQSSNITKIEWDDETWSINEDSNWIRNKK